MVDYSKGKIYKITGGDLDPYIGSTTQPLSKRMVEHRSRAKNNLHTTASQQLFQFDDCVITLIEDYPCKNKEQLVARERYWISQMKTINKVKPYRTEEEKQNGYKNKYHEYYLNKKEKNNLIINPEIIF